MQDENAAPNTSVAENEKLESLKVCFPDYKEEQLLAALCKANWDSDKALEILFEISFNQNN